MDCMIRWLRRPAGSAAARLLRNAKFVGFSGMGHDLPRELWPQFADEIAALVGRAEAQSAAGDEKSRPLYA